MESIFKLGILLKMNDMVSGPVANIGKGIDQLKYKAEAMGQKFEDFQKYGAFVAVGGAIILAALAGTVKSTVDTQKALGELSSVGVKDLRALEIAGQEFSNQWSGTTKAQFIAAAYDIKGGIASLSDMGVAEFAKLAALTAKATKSTTQEMTALFASGYGIYKDQYKNLSDIEFGRVFSGSIAASVNIFRSEGSKMAQAITTLGAAATTAKIPMEEQMTILGMLQQTMAGGDAGTKYRAFMQGAAEAGQKLNLPLMDANNQLLRMPQILTKLHGKFGDTLDALEKIQIQKAFGSQEAVAVIDLMYSKVGDLTNNIKLVSDAMKQGTVYTEQMASAMNQDIGAGMGVLGNIWHNLAEILGKQLIPILAPIFAGLANIGLVLQRFAEKHGTLTRVIMVSLAVIGSLLFVLGGVAAVIGTIGLGIPLVITGMGLISGAFATATVAVWKFTAALLINPLFWIPAAIVAVCAALIWLYNRFESVRTVIQFINFFIGFLLGNLLKLATLSGWLNLFNSGRAIVSTLVSGIKSMAMGPVNAIKDIFTKVRNLLPFSDAKEGPLSQLTLSGSRIISTLGAGITGAAPGLYKTMATALAGAALVTSIGITPAMAALPKPPSLPAIAAPGGSAPSQAAKQTMSGSKEDGRKVIIQNQNLYITMPNVSDGKSFICELQHLIEGFDVN